MLVPEIRYSRRNGLELSVPYYIRLGPNRDATITPHVYTDVLPMLEAEYRQLTSLGAFQVARLSHLRLAARRSTRRRGTPEDEGIRAYIEGNGRLILSPTWSVTAHGRYVTDRTFMRRYDISRDDRLRSFVDAERITADSYISIAGWAFQGLRLTDVDGHAADRPARDRRALAARRSRCSAAGSSCRPTASPSCAPRARTASAPSPARAGSGAASPRSARSWC